MPGGRTTGADRDLSAFKSRQVTRNKNEPFGVDNRAGLESSGSVYKAAGNQNKSLHARRRLFLLASLMKQSRNDDRYGDVGNMEDLLC